MLILNSGGIANPSERIYFVFFALLNNSCPRLIVTFHNLGGVSEEKINKFILFFAQLALTLCSNLKKVKKDDILLPNIR